MTRYTCNVKDHYLLGWRGLQFDWIGNQYHSLIVGAVVVVKWSACSHSIPKIRVRIPLKATIFL